MKLFILGSTGDLVKRKVLPALQEMGRRELDIIAIGRKDFNDELYRDFVCSGKCKEWFLKKIKYSQLNFEEEDLCLKCTDMLDEKEINYFYISLPPKNLDKILRSIGKLKNDGFKVKILAEKPFGENRDHAEELIKIIKKYDLFEDMFLSDHYVFKKNIINMKKMDFKRLGIVALEKVGLEGRTSYYDGIGALKDMIQSHFFNILFKTIEKEKLHTKPKVKHYIKGQYREYTKELGKSSKTETFVHIGLDFGGKYIEFITGKAFNDKKGHIEIDGEIIPIETGENSYVETFKHFFLHNKEAFPSIENAIFAWQLIEHIENHEPEWIYYEGGYPIDKTSIDEIRKSIKHKKEHK